MGCSGRVTMQTFDLQQKYSGSLLRERLAN